MKRAFTISLLASFLLPTCLLFAQVDKTLIKSFNLQGQSAMTLDLRHPVEVRNWTNESVQIQMNIHFPNGTESSLKSLIQTGRYNMVSESNEQGLQIKCPSLQRAVTYNGGSLNEVISFVVFVPVGTVVTIVNAETALVSAELEVTKQN